MCIRLVTELNKSNKTNSLHFFINCANTGKLDSLCSVSFDQFLQKKPHYHLIS